MSMIADLSCQRIRGGQTIPSTIAAINPNDRSAIRTFSRRVISIVASFAGQTGAGVLQSSRHAREDYEAGPTRRKTKSVVHRNNLHTIPPRFGRKHLCH
jgi:hypothetical protein